MATTRKAKSRVYGQCASAVRKLIAEPPSEHGGVFTELDVVALAGTSEWSQDDYESAMRHANQVVGTYYRSRKLCRYGPVTLPTGDIDYARIASKIVYADAASGPQTWTTPNGTWPRMMFEDDPITKQGRRAGTVRNDLVPWNQGDPAPAPSETHPPDVVLAELRELRERVSRLESIEAKRRKVYVGG